jgi:hypothetical protein
MTGPFIPEYPIWADIPILAGLCYLALVPSIYQYTTRLYIATMFGIFIAARYVMGPDGIFRTPEEVL